jgi:hypothetical protein
VLDRRVDMISPLLTQLTYEGLIDELVGIKNCAPARALPRPYSLTRRTAHVLLPASFLAPPKAPAAATSPTTATVALPTVSVKQEQKKKYRLSTETDPLLAELRDLNFSAVGKRLSKTAHRLNENYNVCAVDDEGEWTLRLCAAGSPPGEDGPAAS